MRPPASRAELLMRAGFAAILLAALLFVGFRPVGQLPPVGRLLDPANGVWATARTANLPPLERGRIPGLSKSVEVVFDDRGVPHIYAATEEDAFRALGFVMARDRLFQMELQTRAAEGRLTEWIGPRVLDVDRRTRALGLRWGAERKLAAAKRNTIGYRAINAYADGVNAWISSMRPRDLPMEYRLLGVTPGKWEPIYSLSFFSKMALTLAFNDATYNRLSAQAKVGRAAADALFPVNSPHSGADSAERPARSAVRRCRDAPAGRAGQRGAARAGRARVGCSLALGGLKAEPQRRCARQQQLGGVAETSCVRPCAARRRSASRADAAVGLVRDAPRRSRKARRRRRRISRCAGGDHRLQSRRRVDVHQHRLRRQRLLRRSVDDAAHPTRYRVDGAWRPLEKRIETYRDRTGAVIRDRHAVLHASRPDVASSSAGGCRCAGRC